ncbi:hypothetical protein DFH09DRAFT_1509540 [Mycena vulgaris]|nr:hypothetical protein DFH09DRAFT_1509540 [Mycena vulgaris]
MTSQDPRRTRIAVLDQGIAQMQAERDTLLASLAFPVITLPVEITSQIFVHRIPDNPLDSNVVDPAVALGHVCRQWRDIALSIPQLWSAWSLAIDGNTHLHRLSSSIELWLNRSQNRPLPIRLYHRDGAGQDVSNADENWWTRASDFRSVVIPVILQHYRRWKHVEFNIPTTLLRAVSSAVVSDELPNLTHLVLGSSQEDWGGSGVAEGPITLFQAAPQLRSLHIILESPKPFHLNRLDNVPLPFHQLTSFTGTIVSMPQVIQSSTLQHLRSLALWWTNPQNARPDIILDRLTLPSLETLAHGGDDTNLPPLLTSLSLRSACTIRHLSCESIEHEELAECLEALPALSTLELLEYSQPDAVDVIRHLQYRLDEEDGAQLVPQLQSITLQCRKYPQDGEFSFNALIWLLQMMAGRPNPLRRCRLTWTTPLLPRRPAAEEIADFQDLVEQGMDIHVGTAEHSWI